MSTKLLQTEGLTIGYNGRAVVEDIDIEVGAGELVALLGRNGAGKTTLMHTVAGIVGPISGNLSLFASIDLGPFHRRTRAGLGLVTEQRMVVHRLSVADNLRLGRGDPKVGLEMFPELKPLVKRRAGLLSGGEQQMLALARTLAAEPKLLLVDELSFGLAPKIVDRLLEALREVASTQGLGILLVEQHPLTALAAADRGYVIANGRIALEGSSETLQSRAGEIEATYLSSGLAASDIADQTQGEREGLTHE